MQIAFGHVATHAERSVVLHEVVLKRGNINSARGKDTGLNRIDCGRRGGWGCAGYDLDGIKLPGCNVGKRNWLSLSGNEVTRGYGESIC